MRAFCILGIALAFATAVAAERSVAELEELLGKARIVKTSVLESGITGSLRLSMRRGKTEISAVFKTVDARRPAPEPPRPDPFITDRWQNEVAAYRIARLLGIDAVPPTVIRKVRGRPGSLQLWVEGVTTRTAWFAARPDTARHAALDAAEETLRVFDALIYNPDRNAENLLLDEAGEKVWFVDHSRAFRALDSWPATVGSEPLVLPEPLRTRLAAIDEATLRAALRSLLAEAQIKALLARRELLLGLPATSSPR